MGPAALRERDFETDDVDFELTGFGKELLRRSSTAIDQIDGDSMFDTTDLIIRPSILLE